LPPEIERLQSECKIKSRLLRKLDLWRRTDREREGDQALLGGSNRLCPECGESQEGGLQRERQERGRC
jgi:hypothetical protein